MVTRTTIAAASAGVRAPRLPTTVQRRAVVLL